MRSFINQRSALTVRQPQFINGKNFLPFIFTRTNTNMKVRWIGFVRSDSVFTSRLYENLGIGDILALWPLQKIPTISGGDGNAQPMLQASNILIQLGYYIEIDPKDGMRIRGVINGNFNGLYSEVGIFVLNFAYVEFMRPTIRYLLGQYMNPLGMYENFPHMVSFSYGGPFIPTSVNPQIFIEKKLQNFNLSFSLYTQFLNTDSGPDATQINEFTGFSTSYVYNAAFPITCVRCEYETDRFHCGFAYNIKRITPRIATSGLRMPSYDEHVWASTVMAFGIFRNSYISGKAQVLWGQDGTDLLSFGGYAVRNNNPNGTRTYSDLRYASAWLEIEKTYVWHGMQPGIFFGFIKNTGSNGPLALFSFSQPDPYGGTASIEMPLTYALDLIAANVQVQKSLGWLFRAAPRVWVFFTEGFQLGVELECSRIRFGYLDQNAQPTMQPDTVSSVRLVASAQYYF